MTRQNLLINIHRGAPGDTVAASALVRDLAVHRPHYRLFVSGSFADDLFRYDPRVACGTPTDATVVEISYRAAMDASASDQSKRYLAAPHECYRAQTGDDLPLNDPRPSLCLGPAEWATPDPEPYAVVAAGSKSDIPLKQAPPDLIAAVIAETPELRWKQVGRTEPGRIQHFQPEIPGAENLLGKTDLRQLIRLIAHARVVLCHTSLPMLIASAFHVPCVVLGGGREDPWFHAADGITYLHAVGRLGCCLTAGCRAVFPRPAHDGRYPLGTLCADPVNTGRLWVGRCMTLHPPAVVVDAVRAAVQSKCYA